MKLIIACIKKTYFNTATSQITQFSLVQFSLVVLDFLGFYEAVAIFSIQIEIESKTADDQNVNKLDVKFGVSHYRKPGSG